MVRIDCEIKRSSRKIKVIDSLGKEEDKYVARIWKDEITIWYLNSFMNLSKKQIQTILDTMNSLKRKTKPWDNVKKINKKLGETRGLKVTAKPSA